MSARPPASSEDRRPRRLHLVGAAIAAVAAVAALVAVNSASVGAAVPDASDAVDDARQAHQSALTTSDPDAIATFSYHAPDVDGSEWCDSMDEHDGDWAGFADEVAAAAADWHNTEEAMFEFVGVIVQSVCPTTATAFVTSTNGG